MTDTIVISISCAVMIAQIWSGIRAYITWRRIDHAWFVNEMRKARREKRRIVAWTQDGAPVLDAPGTAPVERWT
jgi:hypothetical protein